MKDHDGSMTIGAFARVTGVTVSALRFYDDCGLVRPDGVDPATGYRYYSAAQIAETTLIRHLRDVGLPLAGVRQVLAAPAPEAEEILVAHLRALEARLANARSGTRAALALVRHRGRVRLAGAVLAAAVAQVAPAALAHGEPHVLTGILVDVRDGELHLVATDRYRLAARSLPLAQDAIPFAAVVPASALIALRGWLVAQDDVGLGLTEDALTFTGPGEHRAVPLIDEEYPDHRVLFDGLPTPATTAVVPRRELLTAIGDDPCARVALTIGPGAVTVRTTGPTAPTASAGVRIVAEVSGAPLGICFVVGTLRPVVHAAVGPDVLLRLGGPDQPVLVRSADDGDLASLAMPARSPSEGVS